MIALGHRVVCLAPPDAFSDRLVSELGAEHLPLPLIANNTTVLQELQVLSHIWRAFSKHKPDLVFNFTVKLNIYCGVVCAARKIPFINNVSGLGTVFLHDSWKFRQIRRMYIVVNNRAKKLFFQNQDDLTLLRENGLLNKTDVSLIPGSGVNLQRFKLTPPPEGKFTFLMIARLIGDKGVREFVEACRLLKAEDLAIEFQLLGPLGVSNETAITAQEVAQWEEQGVLNYLGEVEDVRPLIERANVVVLPSYREGMPRAVLEAAAMGRPAIVSDVPGCRQAIIEEQTGWLCEVLNPQSLAQQMRRVFAMAPEARLQAGLAAHQNMVSNFDEQVVVKAYIDCLPTDHAPLGSRATQDSTPKSLSQNQPQSREQSRAQPYN